MLNYGVAPTTRTLAVEPAHLGPCHRLVASAEVCAEECLRAGAKVGAVFGPGKSVAFVGVSDVNHVAVVPFDSGDKLFGFSLLDWRVVGAAGR